MQNDKDEKDLEQEILLIQFWKSLESIMRIIKSLLGFIK
jgi:hypothetical protein